MSNCLGAVTFITLGSLAFAPAAIAAETAEPENKAVATETRMNSSETEVRGAVERSDLIAVEGPDGRIYYNRIIPVSELPDPELNLRTLETVEITYEGDVYTNKIVQKVD